MSEHSPSPCEDPGSTPGPELKEHVFGRWIVPKDVIIKDEGWVSVKPDPYDEDSDYCVIMRGGDV